MTSAAAAATDSSVETSIFSVCTRLDQSAPRGFPSAMTSATAAAPLPAASRQPSRMNVSECSTR
eukprot:3416185-Rhodomonas_salina.1